MFRLKTLPWMFVALAATASRTAAAELSIPSVLVKLVEQVEVPAREAGVLDNVAVKEGQYVSEGTMLAQLNDQEAQLARRRAQLELDGVRRQAANDVKVRFARKSLEVAEAQLRRGIESEKRYAKSISPSELDYLRLVVERNELDIEQAQVDLELAQTALELKKNDVEAAEQQLERRRIVAPFAGFVAQMHRQRGEWVEPGQAVVRILRLNRLRAEGLLPASAVHDELGGRPVRLSVKLNDEQTQEFTGTLVFISPEIDPVNGQVRVWAEIENPDLKLRPGMHGTLQIDPSAPQPAK